MTKRSEEFLVLYASQMGTSKQAAQAFCEEAATRLSPAAIPDLTDNTELEITATPVLMKLDDFLKIREAAWTRLLVIFVSSYGKGDAPRDGHRFRDFCDTLSMSAKAKNLLTGVHFAMCGLGNSSFRTYMENPQLIDDALRAAGAERVGPFAKADADKFGEESQENVISKWQDGIWKELAKVLIKEPLSEERLKEMQNKANKLKY